MQQVHYQVLIDDDPDIVLRLLHAGGQCNQRNLQGRTPLNLAEAKKRSAVYPSFCCCWVAVALCLPHNMSILTDWLSLTKRATTSPLQWLLYRSRSLSTRLLPLLLASCDGAGAVNSTSTVMTLSRTTTRYRGKSSISRATTTCLELLLCVELIEGLLPRQARACKCVKPKDKCAGTSRWRCWYGGPTPTTRNGVKWSAPFA